MNFKGTAVRLTAAALLVSSMIVPTFALTGTVTTDNSVLRMREEANTGSTVLKKLADGTQVEILDTLEGWYHISCSGLTGYVSGDYITLNSSEEESVSPEEAVVPLSETPAATSDTETEPVYVRVVNGPLNIRTGPGTDYDKASQLATGRIVEVLSQEEDWYQIEGGYICADYVAQADPSEAAASGKAQEIVDYALQFVGYPYVYGGSSPKGFDCSGFTSYVYKHFGYSLNRSASNQLDNGTPVSMSELQPGDLVIFKKGTTSKRATHVGLYIGNNQFVHASTSKVGVIISKLSDSYYTKGFVGGRRII